MADAEIKLTADAQQAKQELRDLGTEAEQTAKKLEDLGDSGAKGGDDLESAFARIGKAFAVVQAAGATFTAVGRGIQELRASGLADVDDETLAWAQSLEEAGRAATRLDVIGFAAAIGQTLGHAIVDVTDSTRTWTEVNEEAARSLRFLGAEGSAAVDRLRDVIAVQRDFIERQKQARIELDTRTEAIRRQAETERQAGEVTKATAEELQKLLDKYERLGAEPPENVRALTAELGILSTAQEKAAKAAEREAAALEKQAEKARAVKDETAPLVESKREHSAISEVLDKSLRLENEALEEQARLARDAAAAARERLEADRERVAELEGKQQGGALEPSELAELFNLQDGLSERQFEYSEAAQEAEIAEQALSDSRATLSEETQTLSGFMENLTELTQEQKEALGDIGDVDLGGAYRDWQHEVDNFYDSQGNVINQAERFGDVWVTTNERGEEVVTNFTDELGYLEDGLESTESAAEGAASGFGAMAREAGRVGDEAAKGAAKAGDEINSQLDGLDQVIAKLETVEDLWKRIKIAAREAAEEI